MIHFRRNLAFYSGMERFVYWPPSAAAVAAGNSGGPRPFYFTICDKSVNRLTVLHLLTVFIIIITAFNPKVSFLEQTTGFGFRFLLPNVWSESVVEKSRQLNCQHLVNMSRPMHTEKSFPFSLSSLLSIIATCWHELFFFYPSNYWSAVNIPGLSSILFCAWPVCLSFTLTV